MGGRCPTPAEYSVRRDTRHFHTSPRVPAGVGQKAPNTPPTGMRTALCGSRPAGTAIMTTDNTHPPLALRPREAARMLGVSPRTLWGWTRAGIVPCVRVGTGKRRTVLYPVADLQAWLTRQTEGAKGGEQ